MLAVPFKAIRRAVVLLFLCALGLYNPVLGQQMLIDSLRQQISQLPADTSKVNTLIILAEKLYYGGIQDEAKLRAEEALSLSRKLNYLSGEARTYWKLADQALNEDIHQAKKHLLHSLELSRRVEDQEVIVGTLNELGYYYLNYVPAQLDSAHHYFQESLSINQDRYPRDTRYAYRFLSSYFRLKTDNLEALKYVEKALALDTTNLFAWNQKANLLQTLGRTSEAVEIYLKIIRKGEQMDLPFVQTFISNLAHVYAAIGQLDKALQMQSKVLKMQQSGGHELKVASALSAIGGLYLRKNQLDSAYFYLNAARIQIGRHQFECLNHYLGSFGDYHYQLNQLDSAQYYYRQAMKRFEKCENMDAANVNRNSLAGLQMEEGNWQQALSNYQIVYDDAVRLKSPYSLMDGAYGLYQVYKELDQPAQSLRYLEIYQQKKDSVFNAESLAEIARLEANHQFEIKKQELITAQQQESAVMATEIRNRTIIRNIALLAVSVLLFMLLLLYRSYRRKKQANQLISEQNHRILEASGELREAHQKLSELSGFKEGMTNMFAHDMKNALSTILGYAASDPYNRKMHNISRAGSLMLNLVTNMLDVQRFQEAEVPLNMKPVSVQKILNEARDQVELLLQMKSITCEFTIADPSTVTIDADIIIRVVVNLLTNAIKFSKVGDTIWINSKIQPVGTAGHLIITVKDQGPGVAEDKQPYIFDRYGQADVRKSGNTAATGLGLTFCKLAVEAHGGVINLASVEGEGSTFIVSIPLPEIGTLDDHTELIEIAYRPLPWIRERDLPSLQKVMPMLQRLEVYEVGELNRIFEKLDRQGVDSQWVIELKAAVKYSDEDRYIELLGELS